MTKVSVSDLITLNKSEFIINSHATKKLFCESVINEYCSKGIDWLTPQAVQNIAFSKQEMIKQLPNVIDSIESVLYSSQYPEQS